MRIYSCGSSYERPSGAIPPHVKMEWEEELFKVKWLLCGDRWALFIPDARLKPHNRDGVLLGGYLRGFFQQRARKEKKEEEEAKI